MIENGFKNDHKDFRTIYQQVYNKSMVKDPNDSYFYYFYSLLQSYLLYSVEETELIYDKIKYDMINNKWWKPDFNCKVNISNYIWRTLICNNYSIISSSQYQKEKDLIELRKNIVEKLK